MISKVIINIAAGINDILYSTSTVQALNAVPILQWLEQFRSHILSINLYALVSFATIPTVEVGLLPGLVKSPIPNL